MAQNYKFVELYYTTAAVEELLRHDHFSSRNVSVYVKRDDLIDEEVSGNKWRKLKFNIQHAMHLQKEGIVTLGGAYSNHLLAVAKACNAYGLRAVGLVRGEELTPESNSNLKRCAELGMELHFISRSEYGERCEKSQQESWKEHYPTLHFVPEGGSNYHGMVGCQEIHRELVHHYDRIFVAQGTTTTSCGLLTGMKEKTYLHAVPVLKGFESIQEMRQQLQYFYLDAALVEEELQKVVVENNAHFGGYGKWNAELKAFQQQIIQELHLPLDLVYTAKAFYALWKRVEQKSDWEGEKWLFVHTGGLKNA